MNSDKKILLLKIVERDITKIQEIYALKESKNNFLSEDDFKCRLFGMIQASLREYNLENTYSIHSEISFNTKENKLRYRPDISIIENEYFSWGDKPFDWNVDSDGVSLLIEIKFIKKPTSKILEDIDKDIEKLSILSKLNNKSKSFMICFDFTGNAYTDEYPSAENVKFIYAPNK